MVTFEPRLESTHSMVPSSIYFGALGHQVVYIGGPILNGRVAHPCTFFYDDLDHSAEWNELVVYCGAVQPST